MISSIKSGVRAGLAALALTLAATAAVAQPTGDPVWQDAQAAIDAREYETAVPLLLDLADRGSLSAALLLGDIYGEGRLDAGADFAAARRWWREAATGGLAEAQYNLAVTYREGQGTPVDLEEAIRWYRRAAERGDHGAKYQLGQLLLADSDPDRHGEGYMNMRLALIAGTDGMSLPMSLMRADYGLDDAAVTALRTEAASRLWTNALADPANPLNRITIDRSVPTAGVELPGTSDDRDEAHSYIIDHVLRALFGIQGRLGNSIDRPGSAGQAPAFSDVLGVISGLYAQIGREADGRPLIVYPFVASGVPSDSATAANLSGDRIWSIARPGDMVLLTDQGDHHVTFVFGVDRANNRLTFVDVRPDEFLLLDGRNRAGARGVISNDGGTRRLITVTRDEFVGSIAAFGTVGNADFPALLVAAYPDLAEDWRARLSFGASLLGTLACVYVDAAAIHIATAHDLSSDAGAESRNAVADRAMLARALMDACGAVGHTRDAAVPSLSSIPDGTTQSLTFNEMGLLIFTLLDQRRVGLARTIAQTRLKLDPDDPVGHLMLAYVELDSGTPSDGASQLTEAITRLESVLDRDSGAPGFAADSDRGDWEAMLVQAYVGRGQINIEDDPDQAYQDAERALAFDPGNEEAIHLARSAGRLSGHLRRVSDLQGQLDRLDVMSPLFALYGLDY